MPCATCQKCSLKDRSGGRQQAATKVGRRLERARAGGVDGGRLGTEPGGRPSTRARKNRRLETEPRGRADGVDGFAGGFEVLF